MANIQLLNEINKNLAPSARVQVTKEVRKAFQKKKNQMIAEFLNHPITQEIKGGINASNISGTLGGITNLFSFIGFDSSYDPIDPILKILESTTIEEVRAVGKKINYKVNVPTPQEVFAVTPMPWANGRSWAKGIESGISGLGFYLNKKSDKSRSGRGIQTSRKIRGSGVKYRNTKYITELLNRYSKEFQNLKV